MDYKISKRNKLRQIRENAAYDKKTVHEVLDAGILAHVAFVQEGAPVVVPMLYGREGETIFLHGARKARIIRLLEETDQAALNVTIIDALVLARSAFNSSMNYRSVTVFGTPTFIDDRDAKLHAMHVITEATMPGRWDDLRAPLDKEIKMTGIISLSIDSASAKIANKPFPEDEDEDYDIPVWAGILPMKSTYTELEDADRLIDGVEPSAAVKALQGRSL
ncbi:MAG: pyridoxamine 5'-phosphate oxidase family protein [Gammaproteobacteria bacterium]|nr:MAG: pyridoxamine 5'-phosphate oxidase family protein [Gammaproteobacteria bacterium]